MLTFCKVMMISEYSPPPQTELQQLEGMEPTSPPSRPLKTPEINNI